MITQAGGLPVLAHPGESLHTPEDQLPALFKMGIAGIEAFSSYHTPEIADYYVEKARAYGVSLTCGSDFHGKNKPEIALGSVECQGLEREIIESVSRQQT